MTLWTLTCYLLGSRGAILRLAGCRPALAAGFLFVIAAGFAREYDGEDLLHEPWHVLIPLAASLASSAVLYLLVWAIAQGRGSKEPRFFPGYLDFLTLYWLTAPLALVYAIPVERLLSAADATRANLWMLGLVALWRVALMTRVVAVLYGISPWRALFLVMLFADSVAVVILAMTDLPIVAIMGGIRLSESELVLRNTVWMLRVAAVLSWPIWLVGAGIAVFSKQPPWEYQPAATPPYPRAAADVWAATLAAIGMWAFVMPLTQPEQQLRWRVERDLHGGRISEGLQTMSAHEPGDFPPHWDPPPRVAYRERTPDITVVQEHLDIMTVKPWVRAIYVEKFGNWLAGENDYVGAWGELPADEVARQIRLIERMPERLQLVRDNEHSLNRVADGYSELPAELRKRVQKLLQEAGVASGESKPSTLAPAPSDQQALPAAAR
jgi:hypothetical protein